MRPLRKPSIAVYMLVVTSLVGWAIGATPASATTESVFGNGDATFYGSTGSGGVSQPLVGMAVTASGHGYWLAGRDGAIYSFGDATFHGSTGGVHLNQPIVGIARTPSGGGYWMVASDGGIFSFGDAAFHGSTGAIHLNKPIVGIAPTPSGQGYWLVASDGGIFAFGDAAFHGSTGAIHLNQPIVGMASTPDGQGYWLVASDGGVFSFGDAHFYGSTGAIHLNQPIVGMSARHDGAGYWFVARDGGVFNFGAAQFFGSEGGAGLTEPVVGMASTPDDHGYWVATAGHPPPPPVTFGPGEHRVGVDIPAGTYRTRTAASGCYWERESGFSGSTDDIIANNITDFPDVVTIAASDAGFKTSSCATWTSDLSTITPSPTAPFGSGKYIVGDDIASGSWTAPGGSNCYWERLSGFGGTGDEIIANDIGTTNPVVTIHAGDAGFDTHDCGTWSRIG